MVFLNFSGRIMQIFFLCLFACVVSPVFSSHDNQSTTKSSSSLRIRQGSDVCKDEKAILSVRLKKARSVLEATLQRSIEEDLIPTIGIAGSGGGYRAMISMIGFLTALEKNQILDATSYIATVSGSGWALGTWLAHEFSLANLKDFLRTQLMNEFTVTSLNWSSITRTLFQKIKYGQPVNECDAWASLLSHTLLSDLPGNGELIHFSSLAPKIQTGAFPYPILTALLDDSSPYEWFEFSPLEIGSATSKTWIPTQGFGKKFLQGISNDTGPEQTLGYIMGLSGSAFAVPFTEMLQSIMTMIPQKCISLSNVFSQYFQEVTNTIHNAQLPAPTVFNFMKNVPASPHAQNETLSFFDAGVSVNVGVPPLIRRNVTVYLICDASETATHNQNHTLRKAEQYAGSNNLKFPKIDYTSIGSTKASLFYDEQDPEVPVVIYFPNQIAMSTFKFRYTADEFNQVYRYMKDAVDQSYDLICKGIGIALDNLMKIKEKKLSPLT